MGLFDKLRKSAEIAADYSSKFDPDAEGDPNLWDLAIAGADLIVDLAERKDIQKIPVKGLDSLGNAVAGMAPCLHEMLQGAAKSHGSGCLRLSMPPQASKKKTIGEMKNKNGVKAKNDAVAGKIPPAALADFNPYLLSIAASLVSIETGISNILDTQKRTLAFLQEDKESQVEGDMATLTGMMREYKYNWDNESYRANHHKLALDIKRSAEQNIIFYQKQIADITGKEQRINAAFLTKDKQAELQRCLSDYRISLYNYSFAAYLEVMQLGNFAEEFVTQVEDKVLEYTDRYICVFESCCEYLQSKGEKAIETGLLKGLGSAGKAVGGLLGGINGGKARDWLTSSTARFGEDNSVKQQESMEQFRNANADPGNKSFIDGLEKTKVLYNRTDEILIDEDYVYFIPAKH